MSASWIFLRSCRCWWYWFPPHLYICLGPVFYICCNSLCIYSFFSGLQFYVIPEFCCRWFYQRTAIYSIFAVIL